MHPAPLLTVDLAALSANYRLLASRTQGACAAVVKANAYGLGVEHVAPTLANAGCNVFFVATLEEGVQLRGLLPQHEIYVFHGPYAGEEKDYAAHRLIPVVNSPQQLERWRDAPFALHVDTGMTRLGLTDAELDSTLEKDASRITHHASLIMSHLACANEPAHPKNAEQLARFGNARKKLSRARASLVNSSGLFLDPSFHFDVARPGCALYGINPTENENPMRHVATLSAPIIQLRMCERDESVGYGATATVKKGAKLATIQLGYADGFLRCLTGSMIAGYAGGTRAPLVGRVSMDMVMVDVSHIPDAALAQGYVEFVNARQPVDAVAKAAHTIGYEVFTRLGRRVQRRYV